MGEKREELRKRSAQQALAERGENRRGREIHEILEETDRLRVLKPLVSKEEEFRDAANKGYPHLQKKVRQHCRGNGIVYKGYLADPVASSLATRSNFVVECDRRDTVKAMNSLAR
jgi:hypothetical protein